MMNPFVVEKLAHMQHEAILREIEKHRLLKALPQSRPASLMQVFKSLFRVLKIRAPKTGVNHTSRKAGAAEC